MTFYEKGYIINYEDYNLKFNNKKSITVTDLLLKQIEYYIIKEYKPENLVYNKYISLEKKYKKSLIDKKYTIKYLDEELELYKLYNKIWKDIK